MEVLRNAERNLLPSSVPSDLNHPSSSLVLPAISPRDGVKDFRLRFVVAFVLLCSVSSLLHVALSYHAKKISPPSYGPLFNRHSFPVYTYFSDFSSFLTCVQYYILVKLTSNWAVIVKLIAEINANVFRN